MTKTDLKTNQPDRKSKLKYSTPQLPRRYWAVWAEPAHNENESQQHTYKERKKQTYYLPKNIINQLENIDNQLKKYYNKSSVSNPNTENPETSVAFLHTSNNECKIKI